MEAFAPYVQTIAVNLHAGFNLSLQLPNNVHYECEGRQYCALSVVAKILELLYGFGRST